MENALIWGLIGLAGGQFGAGAYAHMHDEDKGFKFKPPRGGTRTDEDPRGGFSHNTGPDSHHNRSETGPNEAERERMRQNEERKKRKRDTRIPTQAPARGPPPPPTSEIPEDLRNAGSGMGKQPKPDMPTASEIPDEVKQHSGGPSDQHPHGSSTGPHSEAPTPSGHASGGSIPFNMPKPEIHRSGKESFSNVGLVRLSHASYIQELNKYNSAFVGR